MPGSAQWAQAITLSALLIFSFKRLPLIFLLLCTLSEGSVTFECTLFSLNIILL